MVSTRSDVDLTQILLWISLGSHLDISATSPPAASALDGGLGWVPLLSNVGTQALYTGVGALGVTFLLAPFGGPDAPSLLGIGAPWQAYAWSGAPGGMSALVRPLVEIALGCAVALAELKRQGIRGPGRTEGNPGRDGPAVGSADGVAEEGQLAYTVAQAAQMRPLYEISASESSLALAALAIFG